MKSHSQRALPLRGPAPSCLPTRGRLSPATPLVQIPPSFAWSFVAKPFHGIPNGHMVFWRRGRDLNPRQGFWPCDGLANRCLRPLGHLSAERAWRACSIYMPAKTSSDRQFQWTHVVYIACPQSLRLSVAAAFIAGAGIQCHICLSTCNDFLHLTGRRVSICHPSHRNTDDLIPPSGGVAERPKALVLKTRVRVTGPWVQIPPPPPQFAMQIMARSRHFATRNDGSAMPAFG